jgi:hypothetical protein
MTTAQRLRYLQAGLAEEERTVREAHLSKELTHYLNPIPPALRRQYLDTLGEYFPTWEMATVSFSAGKDDSRPQTVDELVNALIGMIPRLSDKQRDEIIDRFEKAGVVKLTPSPLSGEGLATVQEALQMRPDTHVDAQRLGHLLAASVQLTLTLHQLADEIWRRMAPASRIQLDTTFAGLRKLLADSLSGEKHATPDAVKTHIEKTRQLIAALLSAADMTGHDFATYFTENLSPPAIREAVRTQGKTGLFDNREARAWECYASRTVHLTGPALERLIRKELAETTEKLARQTPPSQSAT